MIISKATFQKLSIFYYLAQWFLENASKDHEKHYKYILKHDTDSKIKTS